MSPQLTHDLAQALDDLGGGPLRTVHPVTGQGYVLVSEDCYARLRPLFENDPPSPEEQQFYLQEAGRRAGWDDPAMDAYDQYDDQRPRTTT